MTLTAKQRRFLSATAHRLKPVVIVGNAGLTPAVLEEINQRIEHHELVKIRLNAGDRDERLHMITVITQSINAQLVNAIGHVAIFYRPGKKPLIHVPT